MIKRIYIESIYFYIKIRIINLYDLSPASVRQRLIDYLIAYLTVKLF